MTTYIGFDPSTTGAAFAMIDVSSPSSRRFIRADRLMTVDEVRSCIALLLPNVVVAVERPAGLHIHDEGIAAARARAVDLMSTSWSGGEIAGMARYRGLRVVEISPERARSAVGSPRSPQDADVKGALRVLVPTWPKVSNSHTRDAAVVALAASMLGNIPRALEVFA